MAPRIVTFLTCWVAGGLGRAPSPCWSPRCWRRMSGSSRLWILSHYLGKTEESILGPASSQPWGKVESYLELRCPESSLCASWDERMCASWDEGPRAGSASLQMLGELHTAGFRFYSQATCTVRKQGVSGCPHFSFPVFRGPRSRGAHGTCLPKCIATETCNGRSLWVSGSLSPGVSVPHHGEKPQPPQPVLCSCSHADRAGPAFGA